MKNFLMLAIVSICIFTVTGCGSVKTLTCTLEDESSYDEIENTGKQVKLEFNNEGDKILKYSQGMYITYNSSVSDEDFNNSYDEAKSVCDGYKEYTAVTCKATKEGKKISLVTEVNVEKANAKTIEDFYLDEMEGKTYDSMKKDAEENGYTCK